MKPHAGSSLQWLVGLLVAVWALAGASAQPWPQEAVAGRAPTQSDHPGLFDELDKGQGRLMYGMPEKREPGTHTLFDFESEKALDFWVADEGASVELVQSPWPGWGQALRVKFPRNPGQHWPRISILAPHIPWPERTPPSALLSFRLKNLKPVRSPFRVHLRSRERDVHWDIAEFHVPALTEREVRIEIGQAPVPSLTMLTEFMFWVSGPPEDYEFIVDEIVILPGLSEALSDIRREFDVAEGILHTEAAPSIRQPMAERLGGLQARLNTLESRTEQITGGEQVAGWMQEVEQLQQELLSVRGLPGHLQAQACLSALRSAAAFALGIEFSMNKVHYRAFPFTGSFGKEVRLEAARGEFEQAQVVVVPVDRELQNVRWKAFDLVGPQGRSIPLGVRVVGYFKTTRPPYPVDHVGWWPDPLLDYLPTVDVPADAVQPLWLTVRVPEDAPAGHYTGRLQVSADGAGSQEVSVRLRVRDFAVPATRHIRTAINFNPPSNLYSEAWGETMKPKYFQFIRDHRLNVDWIYGDAACLLDEPVEALKDFKRQGQNFITIGFMDFYHRGPDEWMAQVEKRYARAREAGVEDLLWFYGFDEWHLDRLPEMVEVMGQVKQRFPWARILVTVVDPEFGARNALSDLVEAWVPEARVYEQHLPSVAEARRRGQEVWWYVCVGPYPPYAGLLIEQPGIDPRLLMGVMYQKYRPEGFLYASITRQDNNIGQLLDDGPLCDWNPASSTGNHHGEGCLFYPGPNGPISTIRFENFTDGLEDYEYFWVLEDLLHQAEARKGMWSEAQRRRIERAQARTRVPREIVSTLTEFTHSPEALLKIRRRVAEAIESLLALGLEEDGGFIPDDSGGGFTPRNPPQGLAFD